jgi:ribosomal protein S12 methylthiotransferase accessory factor
MTQTAAPFRSVAAEVAVEVALRETDRLGLRLHPQRIGSSEHPTTRSRLIRDGTELAVGYGKGPGAQGLASAHFEALERYLMSASGNRRLATGAASLLPAHRVAGQVELRADLVVRRWATEFPDSLAACVRHEGSWSSPWYPVFLSDPRYFRRPLPGDSVEPYRSLLRYSSSLGTAAGVDRTEAVLHGLCELVEHDAVSHALLRWFISGTVEVDLVEPDDLPDDLQVLHRGAQDAIGQPVHLIDVTTDLGVPAYLAVGELDGDHVSLSGAGAAPLGAYAAERALTELIQGGALAAASVDQTAANVVRRLAPWPALQDCARIPVRRLLSGRVARVSLQTDPDDDPSPQHGLDRVTRLLRRRDIEYYVCDIAPPQSLIAVATTIAPGLERFSLVRLGVPVIPTGRGWSEWTATRPAPMA